MLTHFPLLLSAPPTATTDHDKKINGVPACVDPLLLTVMLREQWKSDAIVQTDCCDSVGSVADFLGIKPFDAFARYVNAGGGAYFGFDVAMYA